MSGKKKKDYSKLSLDDFSDDDSEDGGGFRDEYGGKNNRNEADEFVKNQQVRRFHCCVFFRASGSESQTSTARRQSHRTTIRRNADLSGWTFLKRTIGNPLDRRMLGDCVFCRFAAQSFPVFSRMLVYDVYLF